MILDDIKNFIVQNNIAQEECIKYDYDSSKGSDTVLLQLYDNTPCDLAMRSGINISIKFSDLKLARDTAFILYDKLIPEDNFQKSVAINGKTMHTKLVKGPYYQGLDASKRHNYILNILITYNR